MHRVRRMRAIEKYPRYGAHIDAVFQLHASGKSAEI